MARRLRTEATPGDHVGPAAEQSEVDAGSEAIEILLTLLDQPQDLYRQASKRARKILNFFTHLYVDAPSDTTQIVADKHTDTRGPATQTMPPKRSNSKEAS